MARVSHAPCNLRWGAMGGVPLQSIDVAFSERFTSAEDVCRLLAPGGVWFVYGGLLPAQAFREAGFADLRTTTARSLDRIDLLSTDRVQDLGRLSQAAIDHLFWRMLELLLVACAAIAIVAIVLRRRQRTPLH